MKSRTVARISKEMTRKLVSNPDTVHALLDKLQRERPLPSGHVRRLQVFKNGKGRIFDKIADYEAKPDPRYGWHKRKEQPKGKPRAKPRYRR